MEWGKGNEMHIAFQQFSQYGCEALTHSLHCFRVCSSREGHNSSGFSILPAGCATRGRRTKRGERKNPIRTFHLSRILSKTPTHNCAVTFRIHPNSSGKTFSIFNIESEREMFARTLKRDSKVRGFSDSGNEIFT